jgi:hypothetical protein
VIRGLVFITLLLGPASAWAQELLYVLPGGASADTITTPNGFAAPRGVWYVALSAHSEPRQNDALDGVAVVGMGTGTVKSAVELSVVISDLDRLSGEFLSVKWHFHNETARSPAMAAGIEDITASASRSATAYVAATKTFWDTSASSAFFMRKSVTAGFGGGRFHRHLFWAASASLDAFSKAILEYDGQGLNAGLSISRPVSPRAVAVLVLARQRFDKPEQRAWTMSVALAWDRR